MFKGLLFFINLFFRVSFLLLSSCGCFVYFLFSYGSIFWSRNHFWNKTSRTIIEWYTSFLRLSFSCSFNHVVLTLFPSNQLFNQLKIHNCSLINRFSMIYFGDHHGRFIAKILHLIVLIDNGQNCNSSIWHSLLSSSLQHAFH